MHSQQINEFWFFNCFVYMRYPKTQEKIIFRAFWLQPVQKSDGGLLFGRSKMTTEYIPDFFFAFVFISVFCVSTGLDVALLYYLFLEIKHAVFGILFYLTTWTPIFCMILLDECLEWAVGGKLQVFILALVIVHLESLFIGSSALRSAFRNSPIDLVRPNSFGVFHIPEHCLSCIKIYCFFNSVLKSVPQLFIATILLTRDFCKTNKPFAVICELIIFQNMITMSLMMSILFPVRKSARIFTTACPLVLNAVCKFFGTMSALCLFLVVFIPTFKSIGYYAFILRSVRMIFLIWPCWKILREETQFHRKSFSFRLVFCPIFCLVFSFLYIHPFAGRGKLFYYLLYLGDFIFDIFSLYIFTPAPTEHTTLLYAFEILLGGFVSLYGMFNILHQCKCEKRPPVTREMITNQQQ